MSVRTFGPGERSKNHADESVRGQSALVTEYGKHGVAYISLHAEERMLPFVRIVTSHRIEFDKWYIPDAKTPPKRLAEILHQYARRLGATAEALDILRQFVNITDQEYNTMVAKAAAATPKATFGAAPAKTSTKPAAAEPTEKAPKATKAPAAPKAEKAPKPDETFKFIKLPSADEKLPPQAVKILEVLKAAKKQLTTTELVTALDGEIATKQPVERVLTFYKKRLIDEGYLSVK